MILVAPDAIGALHTRPMRLLAAAVVFVIAIPLAAASQGGRLPVPLPLFPQNNWWNLDVSEAPVDPASAAFITFIGPTRSLHPDFGGDAGDGTIYGIPFIKVDGDQPKRAVDFYYPNQSDGVDHDTGNAFPFYPIPDEAVTQSGWIEGGPPGNVDEGGDRHILIVDTTNNHLYELYDMFHDGSGWTGGSGAFFDMNTNDRRPEGWTSADAAGLAILPGLVRYDEVNDPGEILHAFRVTVRATNGHVFPASHTAGSTSGALPMGARLRLKADKDISAFPADVQKIFRAMKKYGLIVADNGSDMYISGAYDTRWNNDVLNPAFRSLKASDFEVVQRGWHPPVTLTLAMPPVIGAGEEEAATLTAHGSDYQIAHDYRGTVRFTSTDSAASLPADITFTAGDAGVADVSGLVLRSAGPQLVSAADVLDPTITTSTQVIVGPPRPADLAATTVSPLRVDLTWSGSAGATEYEIVRASDGEPFAMLARVPTTSYGDLTVESGKSYLYRVRALDSAGRASPLGPVDVATTIAFSDDPPVAGVTLVRAAHFDELREAVNAFRLAAGLDPFAFTPPAPAGGTVIRADHLAQLRQALAAARTAIGQPSLDWTDPVLSAGVTSARAVHLDELRNALH